MLLMLHARGHRVGGVTAAELVVNRVMEARRERRTTTGSAGCRTFWRMRIKPCNSMRRAPGHHGERLGIEGRLHALRRLATRVLATVRERRPSGAIRAVVPVVWRAGESLQ